MFNKNRKYEDIFCQLPEGWTNMTIDERRERCKKKPVWFLLDKAPYLGYCLYIFYDNVYNQANGEDL